MIFIALCFPDSEQRSQSRAGRWGRPGLCSARCRLGLAVAPGPQLCPPSGLRSLGRQHTCRAGRDISSPSLALGLGQSVPVPTHISDLPTALRARATFPRSTVASTLPGPVHLAPLGGLPRPRPAPAPPVELTCLQTPCSAPALDLQPRGPSHGASCPCPCSPRSWHTQPLGLEHRLPLRALFREGLCSSFVECPLIGIFFPSGSDWVVCLGGRPQGAVRAVASGHMLSTCPVSVTLTLLAWPR